MIDISMWSSIIRYTYMRYQNVGVIWCARFQWYVINLELHRIATFLAISIQISKISNAHLHILQIHNLGKSPFT